MVLHRPDRFLSLRLHLLPAQPLHQREHHQAPQVPQILEVDSPVARRENDACLSGSVRHELRAHPPHADPLDLLPPGSLPLLLLLLHGRPPANLSCLLLSRGGGEHLQMLRKRQRGELRADDLDHGEELHAAERRDVRGGHGRQLAVSVLYLLGRHDHVYRWVRRHRSGHRLGGTHVHRRSGAWGDDLWVHRRQHVNLDRVVRHQKRRDEESD
mmetsp:Transcript_35282/g.110252  ORF Transcript_35282/g.110252 Transcript_35282/m.110252 type:complete len:213 (-) Transcript_35282:2211-2849(-)